MPRPGRMTTERAKDFKGTLGQLLCGHTTQLAESADTLSGVLCQVSHKISLLYGSCFF